MEQSPKDAKPPRRRVVDIEVSTDPSRDEDRSPFYVLYQLSCGHAVSETHDRVKGYRNYKTMQCWDCHLATYTDEYRFFVTHLGGDREGKVEERVKRFESPEDALAHAKFLGEWWRSHAIGAAETSIEVYDEEGRRLQ